VADSTRLDPKLLQILVCPADRGPLLYAGDVLYNPRRKVANAINGAIPVLLPDEAREVSEAEHTQFTAAGAFVVTGTK
jgi:uncharacterized protein YbaR (Trm112 family)